MPVNVVMSGGGRFFLAEAGALQGILEAGWGVSGVAGTSAGGLVALAYAVGKSTDLKKNALSVVPLRLSRSFWPFSYPPGVYTGKGIKKTLKRLLRPTLGESRIPVAVVCANVSTRRQEVLSSWSTPDASSVLSAYSTMAVPGVFYPQEWPQGVLVDGGITSNFALDDIKFPNRFGTIGIRIDYPQERDDPKSTRGFLSSVVDTAIRANVEEDELDSKRISILRIKVQGDSLDFDISRREAVMLFESGRIQALKWASSLA